MPAEIVLLPANGIYRVVFFLVKQDQRSIAGPYSKIRLSSQELQNILILALERKNLTSC